LISTYRIFPTPRRHDQPRTRVTGLDGKTYTRGRSARVGAITQRAGRSVLPRCPTPLSQFGPQAEPNAPSPTPTGEGAFWLRKVRPPSPYPRGNIIARARRPHNPDEHYRSALQVPHPGAHVRHGKGAPHHAEPLCAVRLTHPRGGAHRATRYRWRSALGAEALLCGLPRHTQGGTDGYPRVAAVPSRCHLLGDQAVKEC
jgi:hypothetical protein